jgi:hypothetical protein
MRGIFFLTHINIHITILYHQTNDAYLLQEYSTKITIIFIFVKYNRHITNNSVKPFKNIIYASNFQLFT